MAKLTTNDVTGGYADVTAINDNNALIEAAVENTLSLDGTLPNSMSADFDMDSNNVLNANTVSAAAVQIGGVSVVPGDTLTVGTAASVPNVAAGNIAATDVQSAINELDSEKVGIAGTETITGSKTFSAALTTTNTVNNQGAVDNDSTVNNDGVVTNNSTVINKVGSDVASATALTLGIGNYFDVTGVTAITSIATIGVGTTVTLQFDGVLTFTHHATDLILPGAANITTAAGDIAVLYEYATGDWRCISYTRYSGMPLAYSAGTWTPVLSDGTNDATMGGSNEGSYERIGRQVTIRGSVYVNSMGSVAGDLRVKGLPYLTNTATTLGKGAVSVGWGFGLTITAGQVVAGYFGGGSEDHFKLSLWDSASGTTFMQDTEFTAGRIWIEGSYYTDDAF